MGLHGSLSDGPTAPTSGPGVLDTLFGALPRSLPLMCQSGNMKNREQLASRKLSERDADYLIG